MLPLPLKLANEGLACYLLIKACDNPPGIWWVNDFSQTSRFGGDIYQLQKEGTTTVDGSEIRLATWDIQTLKIMSLFIISTRSRWISTVVFCRKKNTFKKSPKNKLASTFVLPLQKGVYHPTIPSPSGGCTAPARNRLYKPWTLPILRWFLRCRRISRTWVFSVKVHKTWPTGWWRDGNSP